MYQILTSSGSDYTPETVNDYFRMLRNDTVQLVEIFFYYFYHHHQKLTYSFPNLFKYDLCLIPCYFDNRFALTVIDTRNFTINYYDPIYQRKPKALEDFKDILKIFYKEIPFRLINHEKIPRQDKCDESGLYVDQYGALLVAEYMTNAEQFNIHLQQNYSNSELLQIRQNHLDSLTRRKISTNEIFTKCKTIIQQIDDCQDIQQVQNKDEEDTIQVEDSESERSNASSSVEQQDDSEENIDDFDHNLQQVPNKNGKDFILIEDSESVLNNTIKNVDQKGDKEIELKNIDDDVSQDEASPYFEASHSDLSYDKNPKNVEILDIFSEIQDAVSQHSSRDVNVQDNEANRPQVSNDNEVIDENEKEPAGALGVQAITSKSNSRSLKRNKKNRRIRPIEDTEYRCPYSPCKYKGVMLHYFELHINGGGYRPLCKYRREAEPMCEGIWQRAKREWITRKIVDVCQDIPPVANKDGEDSILVENSGLKISNSLNNVEQKDDRETVLEKSKPEPLRRIVRYSGGRYNRYGKQVEETVRRCPYTPCKYKTIKASCFDMHVNGFGVKEPTCKYRRRAEPYNYDKGIWPKAKLQFY